MLATKVSPYKTISNQNGLVRKDIGGARHPTYNQWKQSWNGNRFPPPPSSVVLYMPGFPYTGTTLTDFSGSGNNGTITGATWNRLPSGVWALEFFATDDYIEITPDPVNLTFTTGDFSIVMWVYFDKLSGFQELYCKGLHNTEGIRMIVHNTLERLHFMTAQAAAYQESYSNNSSLTISTWMLLGCSRSGASVKLYKNGANFTVSSGTHINPVTTVRTAKIGIYDDKVANDFDGRMALLRIYNRALQALEMQSLFNQEKHLFGV